MDNTKQTSESLLDLQYRKARVERMQENRPKPAEQEKIAKSLSSNYDYIDRATKVKAEVYERFFTI